MSSGSINAGLEAAHEVKAAVIIQLSHGEAGFYGGKGLKNDDHQASVAGAVAGALHIHKLAPLYEVPVILHTDHAAKKLLPWIDGLLDEGK